MIGLLARHSRWMKRLKERNANNHKLVPKIAAAPGNKVVGCSKRQLKRAFTVRRQTCDKTAGCSSLPIA